MKLLASPSAISKEVRRLLRSGAQLDAAVAWAGSNFPIVDLMLERSAQIHRLIVGLHFYQTSPEFIRRTMDHPGVRFIVSTEGTFHPKVFLFSSADGTWQAIVGSANLTSGGFERNIEAAVLISNTDHGADRAEQELRLFIAQQWDRARAMTQPTLAGYEAMWAAKQPVLRKLASRYGASHHHTGSDGGQGPLGAPILRQTWDDYVLQVRRDQHVEERLSVLDTVRSWFREHDLFAAMSTDVRRRIAGIDAGQNGEPDWRLFGSMVGAGTFKHLVISRPAGLSESLAAIPRDGAVARVDYETFVELFQAAFQGRRGGGDSAVATASRLLAMKRPDVFVCVDSKNRARLCNAFGISQRMAMQAYWESVCERIYDSAWWNAPRPRNHEEGALWDGRAALLDSLYYDP
jgi:hypothetical protein